MARRSGDGGCTPSGPTAVSGLTSFGPSPNDADTVTLTRTCSDGEAVNKYLQTCNGGGCSCGASINDVLTGGTTECKPLKCVLNAATCVGPKTTSSTGDLKNLCSSASTTDITAKLREAMWADAIAYHKAQSKAADAVVAIPVTSATGGSYCSSWSRRTAGDFAWNLWDTTCTQKANPAFAPADVQAPKSSVA